MPQLYRNARTIWRRLISMRTALILLFLLALAAVPGSLLPQRPLNPAKVQTYLATHGAWGRFVDRIGGFDVFGSVWFTAVYVLLFISLVGCLTPRIATYAKALRAKPIKAPRHLQRLAESSSFVTALSPELAADRARQTLRPRWRLITRDEESGSLALSAEKGYSREAGNLLFHVSLLVALVLIAIGRFYSYSETNVVTEGDSFCNTVSVIDSFKAGSRVDVSKLPAFCLKLDTFTASYRADGTPSVFRAAVDYSHSVNSPTLHDVIKVNHPLRLAGDRVYLLNHGYSPTVTIAHPGQAPVSYTQAFLPQDGFLTSEGAVQPNTGDPEKGDQLGLSAIFAPTPEIVSNVVTSTSPVVHDPVLAVLAYKGQLNPGGQPQSVYTLNQQQIATGKLKQVAAKNLRIGQSLTLPDGTVITFTGYKQWASLQISHDPTQAALLAAAVCMVLGLLGSLAIRRRRLWLRVSGRDDGLTLIQVGGLARTDSGNFGEEFSTLCERLRLAMQADSDVGVQFVAETVGAGKES